MEERINELENRLKEFTQNSAYWVEERKYEREFKRHREEKSNTKQALQKWREMRKKKRKGKEIFE